MITLTIMIMIVRVMP